MRLNEREEVEKRLGPLIGEGKLLTIDASETFYSELKGVTDPEAKRKVIGRLFIETFDQAVKEMNLNPENCLITNFIMIDDDRVPSISHIYKMIFYSNFVAKVSCFKARFTPT